MVQRGLFGAIAHCLKTAPLLATLGWRGIAKRTPTVTGYRHTRVQAGHFFLLSCVVALGMACGSAPAGTCVQNHDCGGGLVCLDSQCTAIDLDGGLTDSAVCVGQAELCNGIDDDCDGAADEGLTNCSTCEAECLVVLHPGACSIDVDSGGDTDVSARFNLDWEGTRLVAREHDSDNDGTANSIVRYAYQEGRIATQTVDNDNDGLIDLRIEFQYDESGRHIGQERFDGAGNYSGRGTYALDEGRLVQVDWDLIGTDGVTDRVDVYVRDQMHRLVELKVDEQPDGAAATIWRYEYDADNRLQRQTQTRDGSVAEVRSFTRDVAGNITEIAFDRGADGSINERHRYDYSCWGQVAP